MSETLKRFIFGVLYLAVMVVPMVVYTPLFSLLFLFCSFYGLKEFYRMSMGTALMVPRYMAHIALVLIYVVIYLSLGAGKTIPGMQWFALSLLPLLIACVWPVFSRSARANLELLPYVFAGFIYVGIPFLLWPVLAVEGGAVTGWRLLSVFIVIWLSDVGAYCIGTLFGQRPNSHKLAPEISPKKSWWGVAGALLVGLGSAIALHYIGWMPYTLVHCIVLGVLISICGVIGDLAESVWKRHFGVKDSGRAIPSHGGILDRFDSSLVAIPVVVIYLAVFGLL